MRFFNIATILFDKKFLGIIVTIVGIIVTIIPLFFGKLPLGIARKKPR